MWLWLPEPKAQRMAGLAETQEIHDKYGESGLEMGAKGVSRVCIMAVRHAVVKACQHWAAPELFLYLGFYESGPHCNDPDVTLQLYALQRKLLRSWRRCGISLPWD